MIIAFDEYNASVDFELWLSRADYLAELEPTLHVENLQLITGTGSFERSEMSCSESQGPSFFVGTFSIECDDERLIFGVTELAKMVQRYGALPMDYDWIRINPETDSVAVRYDAGETTRLLVNLSEEIVNATGLFGQQLAAVDAVVAFGSPSVWEGENPTFSVIHLVNDSGNLAVAFGEADQLLLTFEPSLIFNTLPAGKFGASLEAFGSHSVWSEPAYKKVHFGNESGNLTVVFDNATLTIIYDEDLIFNSIPDRKFGESLEALGGHNVWSEPAFNEVLFHNDTANGTLVVTFGTDGAINLTLIYDGSLVFNSFSEGGFRSTLEAYGGHNVWSEPAFNEVLFHNDTANGTLMVYVGNRSSAFVPQITIQFCAELFGGEFPVTLRRMLEWLCDNERFASLLERFDQVIIVCINEDGARVTLSKEDQEQASKTFNLQGVTDPEFAERVIAFFSEFLNPPAQAPALNLLGLLSLMGLLSLVALRRIRPRV